MKVNKSNMAKFIIAVGCVICLSLSLMLKPHLSNTRDSIDFDQIGHVIDRSIDNIAIVNSCFAGIVAYQADDVILTVNGVPLTQQELTFRKRVIEASPQPHKSEQKILDTLIREKVEFSIALQNNVLPSENEVEEFIQWEKNIEGQRIAAEKFCANSSLTVDEYWDVYERYNVRRMLIAKNIFQIYLIQNNIQEDYHRAVLSEEINNNFLDTFNNWVDQAEIVYMDRTSRN